MLKREEISLRQLSGASSHLNKDFFLSSIFSHTHTQYCVTGGYGVIAHIRCNCVKMTDVLTRACASDGVAWKTDDSLCVCLMHLLSSVRGQPHSVTYIPPGAPGQRGDRAEDAGRQP